MNPSGHFGEVDINFNFYKPFVPENLCSFQTRNLTLSLVKIFSFIDKPRNNLQFANTTSTTFKV